VRINLSAAKITEEAVIDVLAFWGGIEIRVPRGWDVENNVTAILAVSSTKPTVMFRPVRRAWSSAAAPSWAVSK